MENSSINNQNSINWTDKVKSLDEHIRKEIGMEGEIESNHILVTVQTGSVEAIEPAFIIGEDEIFLDLFVLSHDGPGLTSTAVLKENIQSIGVIGGVTTEKVDLGEISENAKIYEGITGLYQ